MCIVQPLGGYPTYFVFRTHQFSNTTHNNAFIHYFFFQKVSLHVATRANPKSYKPQTWTFCDIKPTNNIQNHVFTNKLLGAYLTYLQFSVIKWAKSARARKTQLSLSLMKQFRSNCLTLHYESSKDALLLTAQQFSQRCDGS
jgi:hypothetical protein